MALDDVTGPLPHDRVHVEKRVYSLAISLNRLANSGCLNDGSSSVSDRYGGLPCSRGVLVQAPISTRPRNIRWVDESFSFRPAGSPMEKEILELYGEGEGFRDRISPTAAGTYR